MTQLSGQPTAVVLTSVFVCPEDGEVVSGGSARVVLDFVRLLQDAGFKVHVLQKGPRNETVMLNDGLRVEMIKAPLQTSSDFSFARRSWQAARQADLCLYGTPEMGFPFYVRHGVAVQHGIWWDGPRYRGVFGRTVRAVQWLRNICMCKRLRAVVCVDTNFVNYLRNGGAPASAVAKCRYVPNYVDLDRSRIITSGDIRRRHKTRRLLFLRRFEEHRGPTLFLQVCELLHSRNVKFSAKMVGSGSLRGSTRKLIAEKRLQDLVDFDVRGLDDVLEVIDECAISIVPSLWSEGTSLAAVESIALGVPVVATDVGGLGNLVVPYFNGFVTRPAPTDIADCVERLLRDDELYSRMAEHCLTMRDALSLRRWRSSIVHILRDVGLMPSTSWTGEATEGAAPLESAWPATQ